MGTVVLGKLESGSISRGQQLVMMPNKVRWVDFLLEMIASKEAKLVRSLGISMNKLLKVLAWCQV
jgi:translation elongation factor EF-1alpha